MDTPAPVPLPKKARATAAMLRQYQLTCQLHWAQRLESPMTSLLLLLQLEALAVQRPRGSKAVRLTNRRARQLLPGALAHSPGRPRQLMIALGEESCATILCGCPHR